MVGLFSHQNTARFFEHWQNLPRRGHLHLPYADDYMDQAPASLMSSIFIHEVTDAGLLVRFMGTELVSRWRRDDTGKFFGGHMGDRALKLLLSVGQVVVGQPCGMLQRGKVETSVGRTAIFEALLLPIHTADGRPPRMVVFSSILDHLDSQEYGRQFCDPGLREWVDIGAGIPKDPPPPF